MMTYTLLTLALLPALLSAEVAEPKPAALAQAEAAKVEKARLESQVSMQDQLKQAASMTQAQRLEEMAALIDKEEHGTTGEEMIKTLTAEAREALASLQHKFVAHNINALEKIGAVDIPMGVKALDPAHDKAAKEGLSLVQEVTAPFKMHLGELDRKFPMLKPWTGKVNQFASFFEQETLNELFESPVKDLVKYKRVHETFTKEHQEQVENFLEMSDMDDLLTVLRSPEL